MNKFLRTFLILTIAFTFNNCATILTGMRDKIYFYSEPVGADIFINGQKKGVTPATIKVRRTLSKTEVSLRKEKYETQTFVLKKRFNDAYLVNMAGLVGFGIDIWTGAIVKYDTISYERKLKPVIR